MIVVGVIFWLGWRGVQFVGESKDFDKANSGIRKAEVHKATERY
jgi:hypothetical protein